MKFSHNFCILDFKPSIKVDFHIKLGLSASGLKKRPFQVKSISANLFYGMKGINKEHFTLKDCSKSSSFLLFISIYENIQEYLGLLKRSYETIPSIRLKFDPEDAIILRVSSRVVLTPNVFLKLISSSTNV